MSRIVSEIRKGAILIAACEGKPSPALESAIANAISPAEKLLARIDRRLDGRGLTRIRNPHG
jgi:hypothetical protein